MTTDTPDQSPPAGDEQAPGAAATVQVPVYGMVCEGCAATVERGLSRLAICFALMVLVLAILGAYTLRIWRPRVPSYVPAIGGGDGLAGAARTARSLRRYVPVIERTVGWLLLAGAAYFLWLFAVTVAARGLV